MQVYFEMIREVLNYGTRKENRTGVDTLSTFNFNYELCWDEAMYGRKTLVQPQVDRRYIVDSPNAGPGHAVPLLTTKDISWKNIVAEMLWFLSGEPNIAILQRHGCKFWDAWTDDKGNVPSAYGNFWRRFPTHEGPMHFSSGGVEMDFPNGSPGFNDQLAWALAELRRNPMSRRVIVSAWAPGNAQTSKLPPCHMVFAFNVQNMEVGGKVEQRLCLHLTQRSCDLALGVPYNMASYGLLLLIFSHLTGIKPGIFAHTLLDLHIYCAKPDGSMAEYDHLPGLKEQMERVPRSLPRLMIDPGIKELSDIEALMKPGVSTSVILEQFQLHGYNPAPAIKFKVAV